MIFDPFLSLGYVEMIKVFFHPINAVPYILVESIFDEYPSNLIIWIYIQYISNLIPASLSSSML